MYFNLFSKLLNTINDKVYHAYFLPPVGSWGIWNKFVWLIMSLDMNVCMGTNGLNKSILHGFIRIISIVSLHYTQCHVLCCYCIMVILGHGKVIYLFKQTAALKAKAASKTLAMEFSSTAFITSVLSCFFHMHPYIIT